MKENATYCIEKVLEDEGGFVNNPADRGGPTNKGITLTTFRRYINPKGTIEQLKALTVAQAIDVYRQQYWNAVRADELPGGIDYSVFDAAVMSGPSRAIRFLQQALGVTVDGKLGPQTLEAARKADVAKVVMAIADIRLAFYESLSSWATFGRGWEKRVNEVKSDSLALIKEPVTQPNWFQRFLNWLFGRK